MRTCICNMNQRLASEIMIIMVNSDNTGRLGDFRERESDASLLVISSHPATCIKVLSQRAASQSIYAAIREDGVNFPAIVSTLYYGHSLNVAQPA